jgi:long-chain fatty acid transport protein
VALAVLVEFQWARLQGLENFANPLISLHPNHVTDKSFDYSVGVGPSIGWRWDATDYFSIGANYQPRIHMSRFKKYEGFLIHGDIDIPETARVGIAWKPICSTAITFDVNWLAYSKIKSLAHSIDYFIPGNLLGSSNGAGFGWRDQWFFRIGVDHALTENLTIRAGFRHATLVFSRHNTALNAITMNILQDYICVGGTYKWGCNLELSTYYSYGVHNWVKGKNSIPLPIGGGNLDLSSAQHLLGFAFGWNY